MNNPYTPSLKAALERPNSPEARQAQRTFKVLTLGFLAYAVLGHAFFYWKVVSVYNNIGAAGAGAYFLGGVIISGLSLVGGLSILATHLYVFRAVKNKASFVAMALGLVLAGAALAYYYDELGQGWALLLRAGIEGASAGR